MQRIFVTFEYSSSSYIAGFIGFVIQSAIIIGVVSCILQSEAAYQYRPTTCISPVCDNDATLCPGSKVCEPVPLEYFFTIDAIIIAIFSFDYGVRAMTCLFVPARVANLVPSKWDSTERMEAFLEKREIALDPKPFKLWYHFYKYAFSWNNLIDLVSIIPFYITLGEGGGSAGTSTSFLRVARLFRILRIIRLGDSKSPTLGILTATLTKSMEALAYNVFFFILVIIVFGSIIFLIEQGSYTVVENLADGWESGFYVRKGIAGLDEISPFKSVASGMYWAAVTLTTLGYGDLYPTSDAGRFIGSVCAMSGILVLAIPVSVVGSIFTELYSATKKNQKKQKQLKKAVQILNEKNSHSLISSRSDSNDKKDSLDAIEMSIRNKSFDLDEDDEELNEDENADGNEGEDNGDNKTEKFNGVKFHRSMNALEVYTKLKTLSTVNGVRAVGLSDLVYLLSKLTEDHAKLAEKYGEIQEISRVLQKEMNLIDKCLPKICGLLHKANQNNQPLSLDVSVKDIIAQAKGNVEKK